VSFVDKLLDFQRKIEVFMLLVFIPASFFMINLTSVVELFSEAPSQRIISHGFHAVRWSIWVWIWIW